jgi:hypothetical protein
MTRRAIAVVLAVAATMMLAACGDPLFKVPSASTASADATASVIETVTLRGAPAPTPMGAVATCGGWSITAKSTKRGQTAGGMRATQGLELLVVTFDLTNGGKKAAEVGSSCFVLADKGGTVYHPVPTTDPAFLFNEDKSVKAGATSEVLMAYAVPERVGPFTWTFTPPGQSGAEPVSATLEIE